MWFVILYIMICEIKSFFVFKTNHPLCTPLFRLFIDVLSNQTRRDGAPDREYSSVTTGWHFIIYISWSRSRYVLNHVSIFMSFQLTVSSWCRWFIKIKSCYIIWFIIAWYPGLIEYLVIVSVSIMSSRDILIGCE